MRSRLIRCRLFSRRIASCLLRGPVLCGAAAFAVYLAVAWLLLPPGAVWSPDEGAKLLQLQNLHFEGGRIDLGIPYSGKDLDPHLKFADASPGNPLRVRSDALYLGRLPSFQVLVLPFHRVMGPLGWYVLPAFGSAASGIIALGLLNERHRRFRMWFLIAFGSPLFIYGTLFWEHSLATCLGLAGMWLAMRMMEGAPGSLARRSALSLVTAVLLASAVYLRLEMLLFALAALGSCWLVARERWRWVVLTAAALVVFLIPYPLLHVALLEGQPFPDNAEYLFYPLLYLKQASWRAVPDLLIGPFVDEAPEPGWLGELWAASAILAIVHGVANTDRPAVRRLRALCLGFSAIAASFFLYRGTPYRSAHGLLLTTPWALLAFYRMREVWDQGDRRARTIVGCAVLGVLAYAVAMVGFRAASPHGGLEWGARFAMPFYPLLALIALWVWEGTQKRVTTYLIAATFLFLGVGFQLRGVWTIRHDKQINDNLNQVITSIPEDHIVSDLWWVPCNAAPVGSQKALYVASGHQGVAEWIELATAHGVDRFGLVTLDATLPDAIAGTVGPFSIGVLETFTIENLFVFRLSITPGHESRIDRSAIDPFIGT